MTAGRASPFRREQRAEEDGECDWDAPADDAESDPYAHTTSRRVRLAGAIATV